MLADGDAPQRLVLADLHEREIGSSTSDIDHQHQADALEHRLEIVTVACGEIVEGGLRFFEQSELFKTGMARGRDCQGASDFIERRGDCDHDLERFERSIGVCVVPCIAHVEQQTR